MYAVLDTETTGLTPAQHHRVAEIAVVLVDADGRVEHEWSTLINPERDLGPQRIHGIRAVDAVRAPRFDDVAAHLVDLFRGRTLVAHNLPFDLMFLDAEFTRLGLDFPVTREVGLCTMTLSTELLSGSGRSLGECCAAADVPLHGWHSAAADTRATAGLLAYYLDAVGTPPPWREVIATASTLVWPRLEPRAFNASPRPRAAAAAAPTGFMASLVDHLPRDPRTELVDPYLAVLDQALADRYLSADETGALTALSRSLGFAAADVETMHHDYLAALARVAMTDRVLTDDERDDLDRVAAILGLGPTDVDTALLAASLPPQSEPFALASGARVVFTGEMPDSHEAWARRAEAYGLVVLSGVSPDVDVVVAADAWTMSGKAKKARGYGIPVITVDEFTQHLEA